MEKSLERKFWVVCLSLFQFGVIFLSEFCTKMFIFHKKEIYFYRHIELE